MIPSDWAAEIVYTKFELKEVVKDIQNLWKDYELMRIINIWLVDPRINLNAIVQIPGYQLIQLLSQWGKDI